MKTIPKNETKTLELTNFGGRLTRINNGKIDSGLAKFDSSFGYNPFIKPGQLTWFRSLGNLGNFGATGLFIAGCSRIESGVLQNYVLTSSGEIAKMTAEGAGGSFLTFSGNSTTHLSLGSPTFNYGGDICFFGATDTLYIAHDKGVTKCKTDGSAETQVGTWDATHFTPITSRRCFYPFVSKLSGYCLYVANSEPSVTYSNNLAEVSSAGTVNSYNILSPALPVGSYIKDLDISSDLTYLLISSSTIPSELLAPVNDGLNSGSGESYLLKWNGADTGVTTGTALPSFSMSALQTFGNNQMMFMYDSLGASLYDGAQKILTMRNNKSPFPPAVCSTGNFVSWTSPDVYLNPDTGVYKMYGSMYYYGSLNGETIGLYRMFRQTSNQVGGVIYQMPYNQFTTSRFISVDTTPTISEKSNGTHMISFIDYSGSGGSTVNNLWIFYSSPPDINNSPILGVYETQTELFSKRISLSGIRVYTEPTATGNGFQLDLIGSDKKIITNGTFNYSYSAGTDITQLQGALERINFNTNCKNLYALGLRITNTGTSNMTINKIEVDYTESGK